jgi:hypothetical protein
VLSVLSVRAVLQADHKAHRVILDQWVLPDRQTGQKVILDLKASKAFKVSKVSVEERA